MEEPSRMPDIMIIAIQCPGMPFHHLKHQGPQIIFPGFGYPQFIAKDLLCRIQRAKEKHTDDLDK